MTFPLKSLSTISLQKYFVTRKVPIIDISRLFLKSSTFALSILQLNSSPSLPTLWSFAARFINEAEFIFSVLNY